MNHQNSTYLLRINGILTFVEANFPFLEYINRARRNEDDQPRNEEQENKVLICLYNHGFPDFSIILTKDQFQNTQLNAEYLKVFNDSGTIYNLEILHHNENIDNKSSRGEDENNYFKLSRFCCKMKDAVMSINGLLPAEDDKGFQVEKGDVIGNSYGNDSNGANNCQHLIEVRSDSSVDDLSSPNRSIFPSILPDSASKIRRQRVLFIAFNTNGLKGSENGTFYEKTLLKDMQDIETISEFFNSALFEKKTKFVMIGISTGAFLTFSYSTNLTRRSIVQQDGEIRNEKSESHFISNPNLIGIVPIACVDDIPNSYHLDFNPDQIKEFRENGYTRIKTGVPVVMNNKESDVLISKDYLESYQIFPTFEILNKNKKAIGKVPILLIHGTGDQCVPFEMSQNLLKLNSDDKGTESSENSNNKRIRLCEIKDGNHLLTSSKHMKKAQKIISRFILEVISC
ncbi:alpha beta hydrolase [Cryptosporidium felis]|nr:alpha beta hydrolase [Cryptosporidium felis]